MVHSHATQGGLGKGMDQLRSIASSAPHPRLSQSRFHQKGRKTCSTKNKPGSMVYRQSHGGTPSDSLCGKETNPGIQISPRGKEHRNSPPYQHHTNNTHMYSASRKLKDSQAPEYGTTRLNSSQMPPPHYWGKFTCSLRTNKRPYRSSSKNTYKRDTSDHRRAHMRLPSSL